MDKASTKFILEDQLDGSLELDFRDRNTVEVIQKMENFDVILVLERSDLQVLLQGLNEQ